VELAIGEVITPEGRINREPGGYRCFKKCTVTLDRERGFYKYEIPPHSGPAAAARIPSPLDEEIACFRYVEVVGDCQAGEFRRHEVFPRWDDTESAFASSDPVLNKLWDFCKYSIKATGAFGIFIDGERERCPYEGDAYINQLGWFCCVSDPEIPRRTIDFFENHKTWPMEWSLLMPPIVRDYLLYTGDHESVKRWLPMLERRLLNHLVNSDGLLAGDDEYKELIDWPKWERDGYESDGISLVPNACRHGALLAMAELTGDNSYLEKAAQLRKTLRDLMWKNSCFVDSPGSEHTAAHSIFFPVAFGVAAPSELPQLRDLGMKCSVFGAQFLLDALYMGKYDREAMALLTSNGLRSWMNMLNAGSTIAMEAWDDTVKPNQDWNHAWGAAPANLIPRRVCGIRPVSAGFRRFIVDPRPAGVEKLYLEQPTPCGKIIMNYCKGKVDVEFPQGLTAEFNGNEFTGNFSGELR
jgi:hypothetical protein